jgi:hypothetical protein
MKLKFVKESDSVDVLLINSDGTFEGFSYIEMVNRLYLDKNIESPIFEGEFSDPERESISSLFSEISRKCFGDDENIEESVSTEDSINTEGQVLS